MVSGARFAFNLVLAVSVACLKNSRPLVIVLDFEALDAECYRPSPVDQTSTKDP